MGGIQQTKEWLFHIHYMKQFEGRFEDKKKHTQKHYIRIGDGEKHKKIAQVRGGSKKNGFRFRKTETKIKKKV